MKETNQSVPIDHLLTIDALILMSLFNIEKLDGYIRYLDSFFSFDF